MAGIEHFSTEQIISALEATNGLITLAAQKVGCTPQTIYNRAAKVKKVQEVINEKRDNLVDHAELALRAAVLSKEPWAVAMVLKTLGKSRGYVERQEVTGAEGKPLNITWVEVEGNQAE